MDYQAAVDNNEIDINQVKEQLMMMGFEDSVPDDVLKQFLADIARENRYVAYDSDDTKDSSMEHTDDHSDNCSSESLLENGIVEIFQPVDSSMATKPFASLSHMLPPLLEEDDEDEGEGEEEGESAYDDIVQSLGELNLEEHQPVTFKQQSLVSPNLDGSSDSNLSLHSLSDLSATSTHSEDKDGRCCLPRNDVLFHVPTDLTMDALTAFENEIQTHRTLPFTKDIGEVDSATFIRQPRFSPPTIGGDVSMMTMEGNYNNVQVIKRKTRAIRVPVDNCKNTTREILTSATENFFQDNKENVPPMPCKEPAPSHHLRNVLRPSVPSNGNGSNADMEKRRGLALIYGVSPNLVTGKCKQPLAIKEEGLDVYIDEDCRHNFETIAVPPRDVGNNNNTYKVAAGHRPSRTIRKEPSARPFSVRPGVEIIAPVPILRAVKKGLSVKKATKSDPVSRYQAMQQAWSSDKFLAQKDRRRPESRLKAVDGNVKAKKPSSIPVSTVYQVPTEKKRYDVRSEIRVRDISRSCFNTLFRI